MGVIGKAGGFRLKNEAIKVSIISIVINLILTALKLILGLIGNSVSLISDAVHSASDVLTTFIVIIGIKMSSKDADDDHPYGHEKIESIAELLLAISLLMIGMGIGVSGVKSVINIKNSVMPSGYTLIASIVSIITKETMFWYTIRVANKTQSASLKADAWHHRSDAISSVASFIGIGLSRIGFIYGDAIAGILISILIIKISIDIFIGGTDGLIDHRCSNSIEKNIKDTVIKISGVGRLDDLKTRMFGNKLYVDIEIAVDGNMTLYNAHKIAELVHNTIEKEIDNCKHCMVHVNPL